MASGSKSFFWRAQSRARALIYAARKDESGNPAIEFAMVAAPFFFLLFGIISVGLYFFNVFTLENAVETAGRVIRTGQAQTQQPNPMTKDEFKQLVCDRLPAYMNCSAGTNKIRVNVVNFDNFGTVATPSCLDTNGDLIPTSSSQFAPGGANKVVLVTVCYEWDLTKMFQNNLFWIMPRSTGQSGSAMGNGSTLIQASTVFTVEPYQ